MTLNSLTTDKRVALHIELEFRNDVFFCGRKENTGIPVENPWSKDENQPQTQPT